jgi:RNA polymerase sigma-70 factor (ECF subfamily)
MSDAGSERGGPADGVRRGPATSLSLLERARARDGEAWRRLVHLYHPLVLGWCGRTGVAGADAEDVAQEVFLAAAAGLGSFRRDRPGDTFRGWLRGITRNKVLEHFRRTGRQPRAAGGSDAGRRLAEMPDPLDDPDDDDRDEIARLYRRALELVRGEFEAKTWQMFWLTVVEGRPTDAVAAEMGVTPAAVRQAKSRVLRRLKEEVGDLCDLLG